MQRPVLVSLILCAVAVVACRDTPVDPGSSADPAAAVVAAGLPLSATVQFGLEFGDVGSPFPGSHMHDESFHAYVKVHPRTVVIAAGGTVNFDMASTPAHSLAIYDVGISPGGWRSARLRT